MTAAIRQRKLNYLQRLILICDLTHHLRIASPDSKSLSKPVLALTGFIFAYCILNLFNQKVNQFILKELKNFYTLFCMVRFNYISSA